MNNSDKIRFAELGLEMFQELLRRKEEKTIDVNDVMLIGAINSLSEGTEKDEELRIKISEVIEGQLVSGSYKKES